MIILILLIIIFTVWFGFLVFPGTYFLVDFVPTPVWTLYKWFFDESFFRLWLDVLNRVFGYVFFSKIFFVVLLFLVSYLWLLWSKYFIQKLEIKDKNISTMISASTIFFFAINPFLYESLITQLGIFAFIIAIWYGIYFLITGYDKRINYLFATICLAISWTITPHAIFFIWLILLFYFIYFPQKFSWRKVWIISIIIILLNINWLIWTFFLNKNSTIQSISSFTQDNIDSFQPNSLDNLWVETTSLLGYGFWTEKYHYFILPWEVNNKRFVAWILLLILSLYGAFSLIKNKETKKLWLFLITIGFFAYVFGTGSGNTTFGWINDFLYDHIPFYSGFRDPHKWIGLWFLVVMINFSAWIYYFYDLVCSFVVKSEKDKKSLFVNKYVWSVIVFLLIVAYTPTVLFSFKWQLFLTDYPKDYFAARNVLLSQTEKDKKILVLPWHSYMGCARTNGRIVANTMDKFFKPLDVVISDNIEIWNVYTNSTRTLSKDVEEFLKTKDITILQKNNIWYIVNLRSCADFANYEFLNNLPNTSGIYNSDKIDVLKLK